MRAEETDLPLHQHVPLTFIRRCLDIRLLDPAVIMRQERRARALEQYKLKIKWQDRNTLYILYIYGDISRLIIIPLTGHHCEPVGDTGSSLS